MCVRTHLSSGTIRDVARSDDWRRDDVIGAWSALLRLHATLLPVIDKDVERATGLPLRWYDVLLELDAAPQRRMRMFDLGQAVVLSRTRVSRVVDELESEGLVRRVANPDDGRSAYAELTTDGKAALRKAAPIYLASIREHFGARLRTADAPTLRRILEAALAAE